ncbi:MAG: serine/threonine protein kinase, partial [Deltaproteobacteria bacterium]|nr:serine/threonine protein kinase [Deltaproteobacteria bacterium]
MDPRLGRVVLNFRIEQKLGEGSFGVVYRARHIDLEREVAIKILRPEHSRDQAAVQRFLREARLVCAIDHPAIVQVENSGMLDDEPFYVMELVPGRSLARRLADDGPLTAGQLAVVFREVAGALEAAHAKGVIHRDLKPHNLMIIEDGAAITEVKLCDFGIAKLLDSADSGSQTGGMMGTPHFMAPEQARDAKNVDARADVYGFGATFFAAATGHRPFDGDSVTEVLIKVQQDSPPPLSRYFAAAPPALGAVIDRCLAKAPQDRPRSVREAADAILAQLARMPPTAVAPRIAPPRPEPGATLTAGPTGATGADPLGSTEMKGSIDHDAAPPRRRGRAVAVAIAIAGAALAFAAALAIYVARPGDARDPARLVEAIDAGALAVRDPSPDAQIA